MYKIQVRRLLRPPARVVRRAIYAAINQRLRAMGVNVDKGVRIHGPIHVSLAKESKIILERGSVLNSSCRLNTLEARGPSILKAIRPGAVLTIGADTGGTSITISAAKEVRIGKRVLLGAGVLITDSDHHVVSPPKGTPRRHLGLPAAASDKAVVIEDDVFIGARTVVLKGVTIGKGSVIGAGSVVTKSIPPYSVAAGNPCAVIKNL